MTYIQSSLVIEWNKNQKIRNVFNQNLSLICTHSSCMLYVSMWLNLCDNYDLLRKLIRRLVTDLAMLASYFNFC